MVTAIIFDAGGCYLRGSFIDFVNKSCEVLGINNDFHTDKEVVFDPDFNRGAITADECFRNYFKMPISEEQMESIKGFWTTTWIATDEMMGLVKRLKKNYKLAILSNSDPLNSGKYAERGWYSFFDVLVLSHEVGILKPDKRIYELTLEKLGLPAEECVFIDDQIDALIPAKEMGMKTIQFRGYKQLKKELSDYVVDIG